MTSVKLSLREGNSVAKAVFHSTLGQWVIGENVWLPFCAFCTEHSLVTSFKLDFLEYSISRMFACDVSGGPWNWRLDLNYLCSFYQSFRYLLLANGGVFSASEPSGYCNRLCDALWDTCDMTNVARSQVLRRKFLQIFQLILSKSFYYSVFHFSLHHDSA